MLFIYNISFSQEIYFDLISNENLMNQNRYFSSSKQMISLPFIDDFSNDNFYPDSMLWKENLVFVNRTYALNPITLGVATFDGLDQNGRPYNINLSTSDSQDADTLTSHHINMSLVDSAYFMFFYQPEGLGNDPQLLSLIHI